MDIRPCTTADVRAVVALSAALFCEDAGRRDPTMNLDWPAQEGEAYVRGIIDGPNDVCLVASVGSEPAGYLVGRGRPPSTIRPVRGAALESMYVRPGDRSRGVGTRLIDEFLRWAAAAGARHVSVTASASNGRALAFYRRAGFRSHSVTLALTLPGAPDDLPEETPTALGTTSSQRPRLKVGG